MTYVGYGSCSGCDTLQAIQECGENIPTPEQLKDFMSLCKDLVTITRAGEQPLILNLLSWRNEELWTFTPNI